MANLKEQEKWEDGVYQIEENDPVLGGENGITNKPIKQLANRTLWLKKALELFGKKAAPKDLTADSTSTADETGHTHKLPLASVTAKGVVKLNSQTASDSEQDAATPKAVKIAYDAAVEAKTAADTAQRTANDGVSKADAAQRTANDGVSKANAAQTSANQAKTAADTAQRTANDGVSKADAAQRTANDGVSKANAAQTSANQAKTAADTAQRTANDGVSKADAAQRTANDGVSKANAAQQTANDANNNANTRQLKSELVGEIAFFARSTPPSGWLKANGAAVSRTTYAALFAAIGTTFGAGDGRTTFNLPDLRGEFLRCLDDGRNIDGGRRLGSSQGDEIKTHTINVPNSQWEGNVSGSWFFAERGNGNNNQPNNTITYTGGNETRPRNVALLACIKY